MLTIKNQAGKALVVFAGLAWLLTACTPPGPKALLEGQRLLEKGDYTRALERLEKATSLLSSNAQAWNYLGLAHHHSGHAADAAKAYQTALRMDPNLAEVRFNLGCLWLEQGRPELAKNELMAFTLQRDKDPDGFVKLGTAQLGSRELTAAERSFTQALRLRPKDAEAMTGLGLARLQRGRGSEAALYFNSALKEQPGYPPALLNLARVAEKHLKDKRLALEKYREYRAAGHSFEADQVAASIRELEQELAASTAPKAAEQPQTNRAPEATQTAKVGTPAQEPRTSAPPAKIITSTNPPQVEVTRSDPQRHATNPRPQSSSAPVEPGRRTADDKTTIATPKGSNESPRPVPARETVTTRPTKAPEPPRKETLRPPETVILAAEPTIRAARDIGESKRAEQEPVTRQVPTASPKADDPPPTEKRSFFQKLNPANLFVRNDSASGPRGENLPPAGAQVYRELEPGASMNRAAKEGEAPVVLLRYTYLSPSKPKAGDREGAERAFAEGVKAHKADQLTQAILEYGRATDLDPSYFDPYYNLGLAASRRGDIVLALASYETALAIRPDSIDARYNFALVLKQASYYVDAARELERILRVYPNETRAHLALGNLYAQELRNYAKAREHYLRVLETEPRHAQAGAIRYWLIDHPK